MSRAGGSVGRELWPVLVIAGLLLVAGAYVALSLDRASASVDPQRSARFHQALRTSPGATLSGS